MGNAMKKNMCLNTFSLICVILIVPLRAMALDKIPIQVSILPQQYFVERIGGDRVDVDVLVKPGKSPATYSPTPDQIKKLASSKLYFRIGIHFENGFLSKLTSMAPKTRIIDTRQGIKLRDMGQTHDQGDGDEAAHDDHNHQGQDPHIWMSPILVKHQARTIYSALCDEDPQGKAQYTKNLDLFLADLDHLNDNLSLILKHVAGSNLIVFHPSFGYFTDQYHLKQIAIETMGKAPKGKELASIIKLVKNENARIIFVQPQFDQNAAKKLAEAIHGSVVPIDPLAYDYMENMVSIARAIASGLKNNG